MSVIEEWSEIEVDYVREASRLVTCKNIPPLKILNPKSHSTTTHVVLSNYGGGVVSGDQIGLKVLCREFSKLFLSTQANTRVYKQSEQNKASLQIIEGKLEKGSMAVVFPDPVVLQSESEYNQFQHWDIEKSAIILIVDWLHSGRFDTGEKYQFKSFFSEIKVSIEGKIKLLDRFAFKPSVQLPYSPANFGQYNSTISLYLVGHPVDPKFIYIDEKLRQIRQKYSPLSEDYDNMKRDFKKNAEQRVFAYTKAREEVSILRGMAKNRIELQPFFEDILNELASVDILDFNVLRRKF